MSDTAARGSIVDDGVVQFHQSCAPKVAAAAANLATVKATLDLIRRQPGASSLLGQMHPEWGSGASIAPGQFLAQVLPFHSHYKRESLRSGARYAYKTMVPTELVIGESWRWLPSDISTQDQNDVIAKANIDFAGSTAENIQRECADYVYVRPIGVVVAAEGKNRVALFRQRGISHIPAIVADEGYFPAERLKIYATRDAVLAVLDDRFVESMQVAAVAMPLLEAYGVVVEREWPVAYPNLKRVMAALALGDCCDTFPAVDLARLSEDEQFDSTPFNVPLIDIGSVIIPGWGYWKKLLLLLLCLLCGTVATSRWSEVQGLFLLAMGGTGALLFAPFLSVWKCRGADLREGIRQHQKYQWRSESARSPNTGGIPTWR